MSGQLQSAAVLLPGKGPHSRSGRWGEEKNLTPAGNRTPDVQPETCRYPDSVPSKICRLKCFTGHIASFHVCFIPSSIAIFNSTQYNLSDGEYIVKYTISMSQNPSLLGKLILAKLVKKLHIFCGTLNYINVFAKTHHWSVPWARCTQYTHPHPISLIAFLILSCKVVLPFVSSVTHGK
jgi:hypothetical protein